jgi:cytochrome c
VKTKTFKSRSVQALATMLATGAALVVLMHPTPARADAASGKQTFAVCAACHSTSGSDGVGPHLDGVVGRKSGSVSGFNYSRAMKQANVVWDDKTLVAFLANPQAAVPGNHMPFSGLQDPQQRADVVAYLKTLR